MLDRLAPRPGARQHPKRVGRGPGSGLHKTSGRGVKGQGKRSAGRETPMYYEGGQMPLVRRLPKRGFTNIHRKAVDVVNVGALGVFAAGTTVDRALLARRGLVGGRFPVKLLGDGEAPPELVVKVDRVSSAARRKIEEAGGRVEIQA